ncbi:MAG: hypothetical protein LC749_04865, partial [Actinobacteria bacterium]|nr:hypothetical protein [Actinomycetota bacterium]
MAARVRAGERAARGPWAVPAVGSSETIKDRSPSCTWTRIGLNTRGRGDRVPARDPLPGLSRLRRRSWIPAFRACRKAFPP